MQDHRKVVETVSEPPLSRPMICDHLTYNLSSVLQVSPNLADKLKDRDYIQEKLGVSSDSPDDSLPPSFDDMLQRYEDQLNEFWGFFHKMFSIDHAKSPKRTFNVKQKFCLQTVFEEWYNEKGFVSILFKDITRKNHVTDLLSRWTIKYTGKS
jgi:hypothetical protein